MTITQRRQRTRRPSRLTRQVGYGLAIGINAVILWIVQNLGVWTWPSFVTEEWSRVRWLVSLSVVATIAANVAFLVYDTPWFKALGEAVSGVFSVLAAIRVFTVFPFEFSGYGGVWSGVARILLVIAIVGGSIAVFANLTKSLIALGSR